MQYFRLPFVCVSPDFDETSVVYSGDPFAYSQELSVGKAKSIAERRSNSSELILTADTVVAYKGEIFNKPGSRERAVSMLKALQGTTHSVVTSITLLRGDKLSTRSELTKVSFIPIPDEYLGRYVDAFSTLDKCGGYSIQDGGSVIIQEIQGCSYNVQGLPIKTLKNLLLEFNVNLWDYLL
ncbi:maf-like family protein [Chlamydia ibidis]|uniref:Nucleoside triphosphate pyrophosphatase n=2 Tax=Chlamydia ibidis TaxID=1405396 RepID=S7KIZ6_9CHLA|nr:maf-like family protein [Chlamydia ibidis]EQM63164.1 maf-like family protein [Chlamydia ibidis 10-1398/6]